MTMPNDIINYCTLSVLFLALVFNAVLFFLAKTNLSAKYSSYLLVTFVYVLFCQIIEHNPSILPNKIFTLTDIFIYLLSTVLYFRFIALAFNITKTQTYTIWVLLQLAYLAIAFYMFVVVVLVVFFSDYAYWTTKFILILALFLIPGFTYGWIYFIRLNKTPFVKLISIGAFFLLLFTTIAAAIIYKFPGSIEHYSWFACGIFGETVFFSAAMAYKFYENLQTNLTISQKIIEQQQLFYLVELEKQNEITSIKRKQQKKIAAEMHDELSSGLAALKFYVESFKIRQTDKKFAADLQDIENETKSLYIQTNTYIQKLHNEHLIDKEYFDLVGFLDTLTEKFSNTNLSINLDVDKHNLQTMLTSEQKDSLYLIIKEAVANILKHANASIIQIWIRLNTEICKFSITDNGKGFGNSLSQQGLGLNNIKDRIKFLKGVTNIQSSEEGTIISANFPLTSKRNLF